MDAHLRNRLTAYCIGTDLSLHQCIVLYVVGLVSHMHPPRLGEYAVDMAQEWLGHKMTLAEAAAANMALCDRGLLQLVDGDALVQIREYLSRYPTVEGPASGLPDVGCVDLTLLGASVFARLETDVLQRSWFERGGGVVSNSDSVNTIYDATQKGVAWYYFGDFVRAGLRTKVDSMQQIGPWRGRWWQVYPSGWKLVVNILKE